jgi:lysophospholipase L1-like esterase
LSISNVSPANFYCQQPIMVLMDLKQEYIFLILGVSFLSGLMAPSVTSLDASTITGVFHDSSNSYETNKELPEEPPGVVKGAEGKNRHILRPNFSTNFSGYRVHMPHSVMRINRDGYRDQLYNKTKPDNTIRILALGDSVTFGWGVNRSDIWTEVAERKLNEKFERNFQVINFGVHAYNTSMEVDMLEEKGLKYNPDIVILQYHRNDARNISKKKKLEAKYKERLKEEYPDFNMSEKKYRLMVKREAGRELERDRRNMSIEKDMAAVGPQLSRLEDIQARNSFSTYVFAWSNMEHHNHLRELALRNNLNFIGMEEQLEIYQPEKTENNPYRFPDRHPNVKGHKLIAEGVLESEEFPY